MVWVANYSGYQCSSALCGYVKLLASGTQRGRERVSPVVKWFGCTYKVFPVCKNGCCFLESFPGFLAEGYYPSTPKQPNLTIHVDVLEFFHLMHMKDPSSKLVFIKLFNLFINLDIY
jgi:hypothetical protein